jgi:putative CocE/NonD family hydrolase
MIKPQYKVKTIKNIHIPMRDGTLLAADLFLPDSEGRFPAALEYYPYRKDDLIGSIVQPGHHYLAQRGIVGILLDIRGTGASEGYTTDEYLPIEQQDGYDAIEWISKQEWCNGNVGMFGISYGGYTSLMVAMKQPPSLKAIVPICATDDRYTEGDQYRGGAKRGLMADGFYGPWMVAMNSLPPYPEIVGEKWAEIWEKHLDKNQPWALNWIEKQSDGPYWQDALGRKYHKIKCPMFAITGWMDYFPNAMTRLYANLKVPKKLLIGPWAHGLPDHAIPGPNIDYLNEMVRWFSYWLNDEDTGIMDEPPVTVFVQNYSRPNRLRDFTKGFWRNENSWPPKRMKELPLYIEKSELVQTIPGDIGPDSYEHNPVTGSWASGPWPYSQLIRYVFPGDQRHEDALGLVYDTPVLKDDCEILGRPKAVLFVSSTAEVTFFVAKLCDVAPDGISAQVTKGVLNATRRKSMEHPEPLEPGKIYEITLDLDETSWIFEKGHKIRLSLCSSDWPEIWPSPKKAINTLYKGNSYPSRLVLPVVSEQKPKIPGPKFMLPSTPVGKAVFSMPQSNMEIRQNIYNETMEIHASRINKIELPDNIGVFSDTLETKGIASMKDPADVNITSTDTLRIERKDFIVESKAMSVTTSTEETFNQVIDLEVRLNDMLHLSRRWMKTVPRNLI